MQTAQGKRTEEMRKQRQEVKLQVVFQNKTGSAWYSGRTQKETSLDRQRQKKTPQIQ